MIVRDWPGYSAQKNFAAARRRNDWVLSMDADERVTPALAARSGAAREREPAARGYRIPRVSHYLGRWIRTTDWYPDYQLRLYDRRAGTLERAARPRIVPAPTGEPAMLRQELEHYAYRDIAHHLEKIDRYTTLIAEQWVRGGARAPVRWRSRCIRRSRSCATTCCAPASGTGAAGLIVSLLNSYYVFLKVCEALGASQHRAERRA